jgi:photosystem II stability/assembly factor-like uncharacterized protein
MTAEAQFPDIVYALAASPHFAQDGICFAARGSGLYRSDDGGQAWRLAYDSLELEAPLPTMAVAVSPDFAADQMLFAGVPGAILRSFDGGRAWDVVRLPSPPPVVSCLVISPDYARDGTLLAGTLEDGVLCSSNRGGQWAMWNFGLLDLNVLCLAISPDFSRDETLFAGTDTGIFCSSNGGRAWREVDLATELAPVLALALCPHYAQDGQLFAGTEAHGLYLSSDRGRTWARRGEGVIRDAVNALLLSPDLAEKPAVLALLSDRLLLSRDSGTSWLEWRASTVSGEELACVAAPLGLGPGAPLLVGRADGQIVHLAVEGGSWGLAS